MHPGIEHATVYEGISNEGIGLVGTRMGREFCRVSSLRLRRRCAKLLTLDREEPEKRVEKIRFKRARGEKLTKQEEKILAYGYYAANRRSVAVRLRNKGQRLRWRP